MSSPDRSPSSTWPAVPIKGCVRWLAIHDGHLWKATEVDGQPVLRRWGPEGEPDFIFSFDEVEARFGHLEPWDDAP